VYNEYMLIKREKNKTGAKNRKAEQVLPRREY
jgi:hypothetical protein